MLFTVGFTKLYVDGSTVPCQLLHPGGTCVGASCSPYPLRYLPTNIVRYPACCSHTGSVRCSSNAATPPPAPLIVTRPVVVGVLAGQQRRARGHADRCRRQAVAQRDALVGHQVPQVRHVLHRVPRRVVDGDHQQVGMLDRLVERRRRPSVARGPARTRRCPARAACRSGRCTAGRLCAARGRPPPPLHAVAASPAAVTTAAAARQRERSEACGIGGPSERGVVGGLGQYRSATHTLPGSEKGRLEGVVRLAHRPEHRQVLGPAEARTRHPRAARASW